MGWCRDGVGHAQAINPPDPPMRATRLPGVANALMPLSSSSSWGTSSRTEAADPECDTRLGTLTRTTTPAASAVALWSVPSAASGASSLKVAAEAVLLPAVPAVLLRLLTLRRLALLVAEGLGTKYLQNKRQQRQATAPP